MLSRNRIPWLLCLFTAIVVGGANAAYFGYKWLVDDGPDSMRCTGGGTCPSSETINIVGTLIASSVALIALVILAVMVLRWHKEDAQATATQVRD